MDVDWERMLVPATPLLETFLRGTLTYLGLFFLLRFTLKREAGTVSITNILVIVLLADAAQNAMADDYTSVTDGVLLVATILGWSAALDWLGYRYPRLQRLVHPPPLPLVRNGRVLRQNLKRELITDEELESLLRQQGVADIRDVVEARMEGDGRLSVITRSPAPPPSRPPEPRTP